MRNVSRFIILTLTALLWGAVGYAQQQPPAQIPLGDVVKQQKAEKKATKVVTDDDLPARAPEPAAASDATSANPAAGGAAKDAEAKPGEPASAEEQKRLEKIQELKESEEGEKRIIKKMEESLADPNLSDFRRQMYSDTLIRGREVLEKITKEREALEKQKAVAGS